MSLLHEFVAVKLQKKIVLPSDSVLKDDTQFDTLADVNRYHATLQ